MLLFFAPNNFGDNIYHRAKQFAFLLSMAKVTERTTAHESDTTKMATKQLGLRAWAPGLLSSDKFNNDRSP